MTSVAFNYVYYALYTLKQRTRSTKFMKERNEIKVAKNKEVLVLLQNTFHPRSIL